jgi:hypothetical protein
VNRVNPPHCANPLPDPDESATSTPGIVGILVSTRLIFLK